MRHSPIIAYLWAAASSATLVISWREAAATAIQIATFALTGIGGALILLYQKKLSADREDRDICRAADLAYDLTAKMKADDIAEALTRSALQEVHSRLDSEIAQRNQLAQRNDQLIDQMAHLAERVERTRCVFPTIDGSARCAGQEKPPCTV